MRGNRRRKDPLAHVSPNVLRANPRRMARTGGLLLFGSLLGAIPLQVHDRLGLATIGLLVLAGYGGLLVHNAQRSHLRKAVALYRIIRLYGGHNANLVTDELLSADASAREVALGSLRHEESEEAVPQA